MRSTLASDLHRKIRLTSSTPCGNGLSSQSFSGNRWRMRPWPSPSTAETDKHIRSSCLYLYIHKIDHILKRGHFVTLGQQTFQFPYKMHLFLRNKLRLFMAQLCGYPQLCINYAKCMNWKFIWCWLLRRFLHCSVLSISVAQWRSRRTSPPKPFFLHTGTHNFAPSEIFIYRYALVLKKDGGRQNLS